MRTKPQSSQRKMSWAGMLITLAVIILCSGGQKAIAQQWSTSSNDIYNSNTGNVGIGTSTPYSRLEIARPGAVTTTNTYDFTNPLITLRNTSATNNNYAGIGFGNSAASGWLTSAIYGVNENHTATPSGHLEFFVKNAGNFFEAMRITAGGNIGVGTTTPGAKLEVVGNVNVTGTGNITAAGTIEGGNIKAKYQDVAEWVESSQELPTGTLVVLDHTKSNQVIASSQAYDTRVAGVISEQPGIALGEEAANRVLVATTGRVRMKVDATQAAISIGDLLVTSDIPGVAMKSQPLNVGGVAIHRPGTIIGKALEPMAKGSGEILVLLSLQ
ncbi:MAG TPA: peptidase G2 autoproteolytic cleavage domain-containing protein [Pyrinomonadaceae bacterium]|nr:peptidase G2 autoproteolytic cleavage domain-containing protein [Pyrinomonadaceae bacterium]